MLELKKFVSTNERIKEDPEEEKYSPLQEAPSLFMSNENIEKQD